MTTASIDGRIKLRHLQCFLAVVQRRSLQAAARTLSVSQPAVSKTLRELEEILGARLFERGRQGATPTAAGQAFARHAGAALSALREGVAALAESGSDSPAVLAVGALPTVAPGLLADALAERGPGGRPLRVAVTVEANASLLERLRRGELELVVGRWSDPDRLDGLVFERLLAEPLLIAVRPGHPLLDEPASALARLPGCRVVLAVPGTSIRAAADAFAVANGLPAWRDTVETLSVSLGRALARATDAVWIVPAGAVRDDLAAGMLRRLPVSTAGTDDPIGVVRRAAGELSPQARGLVDALRRAAARNGAGTPTDA